MRTFYLLVVVTLLSLSLCGDWENWNTGTLRVAPSFNIPSHFSRNKVPGNNNVLGLNLNYAKNQYTFYGIDSTYQCQLSCGPRSFLTVQVNGIALCKKDSQYWGTTSWCVPDADISDSCDHYGTYGQGIDVLGTIGLCSSSALTGTVYAGFPCCYDHGGSPIPLENPALVANVTNPHALYDYE